jgi:hypothetical protein
VPDLAAPVRIRILASDLPGLSCGPSPERPSGHHNIHVAVQRRGKPHDLLDPQPGDADSASWTLDCTATPDATDMKGPYIQGGPGARFIYLSWGVVEGEVFTMFRRAKLLLSDIDPDTLRAAIRGGRLTCRLGLTDERGNPRCAAVRSPLIEWSAR